jgi:hypothetical protein
LKTALSLVSVVAPTDSSVLILGDNRSTKSADGRVATEAAWLNGNNLGKEDINEAEKEKR